MSTTEHPVAGPTSVLLVCSSGGHLNQLLNLEPWWRDRDRAWVTFDKPDAVSLLCDERVYWAHHPTTRSVVNTLRNLALAWQVLRRERPDVIVSNGAGVAVPFFVVAFLLKVPRVYIESWGRPNASLTGRLCKPLSTRFFLQWPEQREHYPDGILIGPLA